MDFIKNALSSKTVWGILIIVIAQVANLFGVHMPVDTSNPDALGVSSDNLDAITRVFTGIGAVLALYGRAVASGPLVRVLMMGVMLSLSVVLGGCETSRVIKETNAVIAQDPEHAPENKAYYAQRLIEAVGVQLSNAVVNTSTPKEIADGIKLALPSIQTVSESLVDARGRYLTTKADVEGLKALGLTPSEEKTRILKLYLDSMNAAAQAADRKRGAMNTQFGSVVNLNEAALQPLLAQ